MRPSERSAPRARRRAATLDLGGAGLDLAGLDLGGSDGTGLDSAGRSALVLLKEGFSILEPYGGGL